MKKEGPFENNQMAIGPVVFPVLAALVLGGVSALWGLNHDQAIFLQAGLREFAGQAAYRDYVIPQGPVAGYVYSLFLAVFRRSGWSLVIASAALNAIMALGVWSVLRDSKVNLRYCLLGGFITAFWFLPIFGSYYNDHLAYTFAVWGFYYYLDKTSSFRKHFLSALLFALSYHSKQSVGIFGVIALLVSEAFHGGLAVFIRSIPLFLAAYAFNLICILACFHGLTEFKAYVQYSILCPLNYARSAKTAFRLASFLALPWNINPIKALKELGIGRLSFYPFVVIYYLAYRVLFLRQLPAVTSFVLCFSILSTLWCGALLGRYHGHLFFGTAIVVAIVWYQHQWKVKGAICVAAILGFTQFFASRGLPSKFDAYYSKTQLFPIRIQQNDVSQATREVVEYLKSRKGSVSVIGARTYLVSAALGIPTENPSIYYQRVLTIPVSGIPLEEWMNRLTRSLEIKKVRYVVMDTAWKSHYAKLMAPVFEYIDHNYVISMQSDFLTVLTRQG